MEVLEKTEEIIREENELLCSEMNNENLISLESGLGFLISLLDIK